MKICKIIKLKKLSPDLKNPYYAHPGDAGLDLFSRESLTLKPGERHEFALGFALEIPEGFVGLIWDKSSLSFKYGLHALGGVFDSNFRGEYKIMLINLGSASYTINKGDKIAQLLIQPIIKAKIKIVDNLSSTSRGSDWLGSTGKK